MVVGGPAIEFGPADCFELRVGNAERIKHRLRHVTLESRYDALDELIVRRRLDCVCRSLAVVYGPSLVAFGNSVRSDIDAKGLEETAAALETSEMTVRRDWRAAKAWLFRRLSEHDA